MPDLIEDKDKKPNLTIITARGPVLENELWQAHLKRLLAYRYQARTNQSVNRMEMATDEDFYDSIQLSNEDIQVLKNRKQPILVYNVIKDTLNWVIGTEKKIRTDFNIVSRHGSPEDSNEAKLKTDIFKFDNDVNHTEHVISYAFGSSVKAGLGWVEVIAKNQLDSPVVIRAEKWRNVWYDHLCAGTMRGTSRFVIREKWIDLDIAELMFEDRIKELRDISQRVNTLYPISQSDLFTGDPATEFDYDNIFDSFHGSEEGLFRERVKIVECQYRVPAKVEVLRLVDKSIPWGSLEGSVYRKGNPDQDYLVKNGYFDTYEVIKMVVRHAYWCGNTYLKDIISPYNHWEFTLIPFWCYIRERDGAPYGIIRDLRDPQIDLNKRRSKALFYMSSNQIVAEKGASDDKEETIAEANRADGYIEYNKGHQLEIKNNLNISAAHVNMAHDDERFIHSIAGHVDPQIAESKKEISGKALVSLKEGTQITSGVIFDNYYFALQLMGEIHLSLLEQFRDVEEEILIGQGTINEKYVKVNTPQEDGSIINSITRTKARFILGKRDFRESVRASMLETLTEITMYLTKTAPQVAVAMLDLVVELMDDLGPLKADIVERIRRINKQSPPLSSMTQEERDAYKQNQEIQAKKEQISELINNELLKAKLKLEKGKADDQVSKSIKAKVEATVVELEGYLKALEVAERVGINPQLTEAADLILEEAKKVDQNNDVVVNQQ